MFGKPLLDAGETPHGKCGDLRDRWEGGWSAGIRHRVRAVENGPVVALHEHALQRPSALASLVALPQVSADGSGQSRIGCVPSAAKQHPAAINEGGGPHAAGYNLAQHLRDRLRIQHARGRERGAAARKTARGSSGGSALRQQPANGKSRLPSALSLATIVALLAGFSLIT